MKISHIFTKWRWRVVNFSNRQGVFKKATLAKISQIWQHWKGRFIKFCVKGPSLRTLDSSIFDHKASTYRVHKIRVKHNIGTDFGESAKDS